MFDNIINHPVGAVAGGVIGQIFIPVPVLGAYLGAEIGAHIAHVREKADIAKWNAEHPK